MSTGKLDSHYADGHEETRLTAGAGRVEWLRTMEILGRWLPPPPARILDVGGGAGAYALPLAAKGYEVHLVDAMDVHVERAREASQEQPEAPLASAAVGDARQLEHPNGSFDAVLMLGPLYHLPESEDRALALREAQRVLRSQGVFFAAGISRFASFCDGLRCGYLREVEFRRIAERDLEDGRHRNPTGRPEWFTTSYFHRPAELAEEVGRAGFDLRELVAVEGPSWLLGNLEEWLRSEEDTRLLLAWLRRVETEPSLLGVSAHLLAVAHRK